MNRRHFLKRAGLWVPGAIAFPAIVRAQLGDPAFVAALTQPAASSGPPTDQLVSWYKFENNANDTQGAHNGTLGGAVNPTYSTPGKIGTYCAEWGDTAKGYVDLGLTFLGTGAYSVAAWIWLTTGGGAFARVLSNEVDIIRCNGRGVLAFSRDSGTSTITSAAAALPADAWVHIAVTSDASGNSTIYVNNAVSGTPGSTGHTSGGGNSLLLGNEIGDDRSIYGKMDSVLIYSKVLSSGELTQIYNMT